MFLTHDNKLKPKWILWGTVITFALIMLGFAGLDKYLYVAIYNPRCDIWSMGSNGFLCSVAFIIGQVFRAQILLPFMFIAFVLIFIKKTLVSGIKYKNTKKQFSLVVIAKDFVSKVRTNYGFLIFSSIFVASFVTKFLKIFIGRLRPIFFEALGVTGFRPFSYDWALTSMPSGHTTVAFAGLVMAGMLSPKIKPYTWTLAIIVGLSRVYIGAHWPSDVIFGAFIGMIAADVVKWLAFRHK